MYTKYFKRLLDVVLSFAALLILSPLLVLLTAIGAFAMHGNPFFTQLRPGKNEKIFKLIKFRTMSNVKDCKGCLLPDEKRLNKYGKFLRKTSLDELPELICILRGDMSIVGPRPLAVQYLPYYNSIERHRHDVRPGLTGLAQINGRNALNWPERFSFDIQYVNELSFKLDVQIVWNTIWKVLKRDNVSVRGTTAIEDFDKFRLAELDLRK